MRLNSSQLELIRQRPQKTTLYLSIFQPTTIFQAQINDPSIARGAREITYDTVSTGSYTNIEANFLMLVGTTPGAQDVGTIRVRFATSSVITISENSNIQWADNLYLTVLHYVRLDPVFPRIIQNPSDPETVTFFKDYDIAYTDQNEALGAFPCAGDHQALFKGEQVYYTNTGTFHLRPGTILNHGWTFEGGSPSSSTSATPGFVTYNTPGHYVTRYTVSGSSGSLDTTYRYISVYDRPGEGDHPPISRWEFSNLSGSRDEGGYQTTIRVYDEVNIAENSVVVIFADDWYGATHQSFGGNSPNNEKIFFVGHVLKNSIRQDWQHSYIEFSVGSVTAAMKTAIGFSISVESKYIPTTWFELRNMDCRKAIYHYLRWHTTALNIADFQFLGTDQNIQYFDADRTSIYDALDNFLRNTLLGKVVADRQGKVWMEVDAQAYSNPTGSFSPVMDITKRDWREEPQIDLEYSDIISYYEAGGIAYSGPFTGTFSPFIACAPGHSPSFRGKVEMPDGLAIQGQEQLKQLVGNVFANENSRLPRIDMDMAGDYRNLDIAPQETTLMTILSSDTVARIPVNGLYIPNGIDWSYDSRNQILLPKIRFVNLVSGIAGDAISIPEIPPGGGYAPGDGLDFDPISGIPPILSSYFTQQVLWQGAGTFTPNESFNAAFVVTSVASQTYGFAPLSLPAASFPAISVAGWYHINVNIEISNTITPAEDAAFFFLPSNGVGLSTTVTYQIPTSAGASTRSFVFSTYMYFNPGGTLLASEVLGSNAVGTFVITMARV